MAHYRYSSRYKRISRGKLVRIAAAGAGICLIAIGGFGLAARYRATHKKHVAAPDGQRVVTTSEGDPSEAPVDPSANYTVAANRPRRILLPTINASGFVQQIGKTKTGEVAVPNNINFSGWYVNGPIPGQEGVSLIDGHVSGKYAPGIFKNINKLKKGDQFTVEYGDHSTKKFEVVSVNTYPLDQINAHLFEPASNIKNQLNLITCGGKFDKASQLYQARVLVVSKAV